MRVEVVVSGVNKKGADQTRGVTAGGQGKQEEPNLNDQLAKGLNAVWEWLGDVPDGKVAEVLLEDLFRNFK